MASKIDMSLDAIAKGKNFSGPKRTFGGGGGLRKSLSENGKPVSDLRTVLAKKQAASITDLRTKLKPKALYTSKLSSRSQQALQAASNSTNGKGSGQKRLKLTASFKNSVSSAIAGSSGSSKSSRGPRSGGPVAHRPRSSSNRLPSYEEAKKISVTVPGLSKPVSEVRG